MVRLQKSMALQASIRQDTLFALLGYDLWENNPEEVSGEKAFVDSYDFININDGEGYNSIGKKADKMWIPLFTQIDLEELEELKKMIESVDLTNRNGAVKFLRMLFDKWYVTLNCIIDSNLY